MIFSINKWTLRKHCSDVLLFGLLWFCNFLTTSGQNIEFLRTTVFSSLKLCIQENQPFQRPSYLVRSGRLCNRSKKLVSFCIWLDFFLGVIHSSEIRIDFLQHVTLSWAPDTPCFNYSFFLLVVETVYHSPFTMFFFNRSEELVRE